jgi:hypothetical protein
VNTPTITPNGGTFRKKVGVSLNCTTSLAKIYYTLDGTTPTAASTLYQSEIEVSRTTTIKAKAIKAGYNDSSVASATFTMTRR